MLHHVTITNQPDNQVFRLMTDVTNLAEMFPSVQVGHGKGMGYKIILLRIYLDQLPEDDHVLFTDAHDVRVTGAREDIMARYWDFGADVVFAAERNCWPVKALEAKYQTHGVYRFLNSGCFIGRVGPLKKLIDENFHNASGSTDDQTFYTNIFLNFQSDRTRVQLDTRATIFQCLHDAMQDIDLDTGRNTETGTTPLVWHSNGYLHQWFMEDICGLEYVPQVKLEIDQQLISPMKDMVAIDVSENFKKYFFKTFCSKEFGGIRETQEFIHKSFPKHWVLITTPDTVLPDKFDYCVYGRVLDTRRLYGVWRVLGGQVDQAPFMRYFQLYYDKTKYWGPREDQGFFDDFARSGQVEILCQQPATMLNN
jgi:hypothetical protein